MFKVLIVQQTQTSTLRYDDVSGSRCCIVSKSLMPTVFYKAINIEC